MPKQQKLWWYLMPHETRPGRVRGATEEEVRTELKKVYQMKDLPPGLKIWPDEEGKK